MKGKYSIFDFIAISQKLSSFKEVIYCMNKILYNLFNKWKNLIWTIKVNKINQVIAIRNKLENNKEKIENIYSKYFQAERIQNECQWMLPKEKVSISNKIEYFLTPEEADLFKVLLFSKLNRRI